MINLSVDTGALCLLELPEQTFRLARYRYDAPWQCALNPDIGYNMSAVVRWRELEQADIDIMAARASNRVYWQLGAAYSDEPL